MRRMATQTILSGRRVRESHLDACANIGVAIQAEIIFTRFHKMWGVAIMRQVTSTAIACEIRLMSRFAGQGFRLNRVAIYTDFLWGIFQYSRCLSFMGGMASKAIFSAGMNGRSGVSGRGKILVASQAESSISVFHQRFIVRTMDFMALVAFSGKSGRMGSFPGGGYYIRMAFGA